MKPTISVIIPAYNAASYLGDALESILRQTYPASQIIVVDDGSTDDTPQILRTYGDRVLTIRQENAGDGAARNRAFREATGTYVAFLDADDVCAPQRFERQVNALARTPDAVACFTGYWRFVGERRLEESPAGDPGDADSLEFLARCMFHNPSVMFQRERASGVLFPEDVRSSGGDIIFTAILATRGRMIAVPGALYGYRSHPGQKSIGNRANSKSNRFFEYRYEWARAHWREHWPERSWEEVERRLWEGLVKQTEDAYRARYKQFFLNDRDYLRKKWPRNLPSPAVIGWRWYPDWLWNAKGRLDRWRGVNGPSLPSKGPLAVPTPNTSAGRMASGNHSTVSVIIPAYNAASYLGDALESVFQQTYPASQIIVVDDGSTDDTQQILRTYRDRVLTIRQPNAGDGAARNRALREATGTYVAFLDADDVCAPQRLERQVDALERTPDAVACFSGYWQFDARGRQCEHTAFIPPTDVDSLEFLSRCQYHIISVMFDRARAEGVRFPEDVRSIGTDIIFSALLATRGRVIAVPDALYGYRSHPAQLSIRHRSNRRSNFFFEYRYEWAKAHWHEYWPDRSWEEVERKLWEGLVGQTEDAYWARYKHFFLNDRNYLRQKWPSNLPPPAVLRWRWYPDWLWKAKERLGGNA